jgi:hypothetical protein
MDEPTRAVLVGPDDGGLGAALSAAGVEVQTVDGVPTGEALDQAGIADAELFVVTDMTEVTTIAVARDRNPGLRVIVYGKGTLPPFARGQTDFAVDPAALAPDTVAEELLGD